MLELAENPKHKRRRRRRMKLRIRRIKVGLKFYSPYRLRKVFGKSKSRKILARKRCYRRHSKKFLGCSTWSALVKRYGAKKAERKYRRRIRRR